MFSEHIENPFDGLWPEGAEPQTAVPRRSTLDGFALEPGCAHGVSLESLTPGTVLDVQTRHTLYRLVVTDPTERKVRIRGGRVFPESTDVRVAGATAGGSALKLGWIGEGLRLELSTDFGPVTTSTVESVNVDGELAA